MYIYIYIYMYIQIYIYMYIHFYIDITVWGQGGVADQWHISEGRDARDLSIVRFHASALPAPTLRMQLVN